MGRCVHPLDAWQRKDGRMFFNGRMGGRYLQLRCGQCITCRLERSRQWAVRCMHEASLHAASAFVTLTYDDEHLESLSLRYRDYQLFAKRARRKLGPFRFFMCGEYGGENWRPHFHACMFGVWPEDRYPWRKRGENQLYRSETLEKLWPHGSVEFGAVTFESAAYVSRYICSKVTGDAAAEHYARVDPRTGELVELQPEFCKMSLKPGIGAEWFRRFKDEVFPLDRVVVRGKETRPPRRYKEWLDRDFPELGKRVSEEREQKFKELMRLDSSRDRLAAIEAVAKAGLSRRSREL